MAAPTTVVHHLILPSSDARPVLRRLGDALTIVCVLVALALLPALILPASAFAAPALPDQAHLEDVPAHAGVAEPSVPAQPEAPVLAWYYPQFANDAGADVANMQRAGIDAFILSQTGYPVGQPLANAAVIRASQATTLSYTVGIETNVVYNSQEHLIGELKRLISQETPAPRWLRYQGKPVIVFWALPHVPTAGGQTPQEAWSAIRQQVDPNRETIWIAEGGDVTPNTGTMSYLPTFDGLHLYSVAWDAEPGRALAGWARRVRTADPSKMWVATVMPGGHYGAGIVGSAQWSYRERDNGAYLIKSWEGAIATSPNLVIVTSYNEAVERTGIYPESIDAGADPATFLDINRRYGDQWRASVGAPAYHP